MIVDPLEHEALAAVRWDSSAARSFVQNIVREADVAFDPRRGWQLHPEDKTGDEGKSLRGVYCGSAGTMWALTRLASQYEIALTNDYAKAIAAVEEAYRADPFETKRVVPSYFLGTVGIMLARFAITGDAAVIDQLCEAMWENIGNPTREALWGSPGTTLAALLLRERYGDDRYDTLIRAVQKELWLSWEPARGDGGLLWEQDLYGERRHFVGAAHGAIGNLAPFVRALDLLANDRRAVLFERIARLLETYLLRDGAAANWWTVGDPRSQNRMQWCHGAPGVIIGLASYPTHDAYVEAMLLAGGEGIWRAGPLRKGPTLCHGTAGNGFALLRLAHRTGEERWRMRAECFATHAMRQVDAWRKTFGRPAFSLWTGELGVALFVNAVLHNDPKVLTLDAM
jgi:hypothetical protein